MAVRISDMSNVDLTVYTKAADTAIPGVINPAARLVFIVDDTAVSVGTFDLVGTNEAGDPIAETVTFPGSGQLTTALTFAAVGSNTVTGITSGYIVERAGADKGQINNWTELVAAVPARLNRSTAENENGGVGSSANGPGTTRTELSSWVAIDWDLVVAAGWTPKRTDVIATVTDVETLEWEVTGVTHMHMGSRTPHHVVCYLKLSDGERRN